MNISFQRQYLAPLIALIFLGTTVFVISSIYREKSSTYQTQAFSCDFFVSTNGTAVGNGSQTTPWDLQTALDKPSSTTSNKTICMKGGTYTGKYISNLSGATLRSAPGEWAKIDGYYIATITSDIPVVAAGTRSDIQLSGNFQIASSMEIMIEGELMQVDTNLGNGVYRVNRGWGGTTIAAHSTGAQVQLLGTIFAVNGSNSTYRDFEIMSSNPTRVSSIPGTGFNSRNEGTGLHVYGDDLKFINLVIHDALNGVGVSENSDNSEMYGLIVYNNGHVASDRAHGHGLYVQNNTGADYYKEIISFNNFALGMKAYGANQGHSNNVHVSGFIGFNNGTPGHWPNSPTAHKTVDRGYGNLEIGSDVHPSNDISVREVMLYHKDATTVEIPGLWLGRAPTGGNSNAIISDNYIAEPSSLISFNQWSNVTGSGNTFVMKDNSDPFFIMNGDKSTFNWNNNTYYGLGRQLNCIGGNKPGPFIGFGLSAICNSFLDFNEWQTLSGLDANSTYTPSRPTGKRIFVRPNIYEPGRAHIAAYNWDLSPTITVDLSNAGLTPGQQFEIRSAEDYLGAPVLANQTYSAGMSVTLPSASRTVAAPIGHSYTPASTCPEFCAYVVVPISAGTPTPATPTISSFSASPATITSGQASTLSWLVGNADSISINNNVGTVTGSSTSVSPTTTTTYTLTATNSNGSVTATTTVTVNAGQTGSSCTGSNCITVDGNQTFQTMKGWEATSWAGSDFPGQWGSYVDEMLTKSVEDLGINRVRLEILSGTENPVDGWEQWRTCTNTADFCKNQWRGMRYNAVNDNADANSVNSNGFHFTKFDEDIDHIVLPLRQKLQARGEQLYINVNYVDFAGSTGLHANSPAEYAEFVLNTYQHMQSRYGFVPDSWEVSLEPDNTGANWTPAHLAAAMKAAGDRLAANGFTPRFVAPSVTNMSNTVSYIDAIASLSGAMQYVDTFSYHLYGGQNDSVLQTIASRAAQYGKKTAQLEYIGATYQHLHKDLKIGQNSAWQQYTFGGETADDGGGYFYVTGGNTVNMGNLAKQLRQYFKYIRKDAVRIGAVNSGNPFIDPLAFRNADGKYVVVTPVSGQTSFGINGLPAGTYGIFYTTTGFVTTHLSNQTIATGDAVSLTNIPAGVVTVYATTGSPPPTPVPTISLNPTSLSFSGVSGGATPASKTISISNSGAGALNWSSSSNQNWCHVSPTSGQVNASASATLTVSVDTPSNIGSFNCSITISDPNASNNPRTLAITYTVTAASDTTPPTVSITAPSSGATVSGSAVTVSASASDNVGVVGVQFKLDGANLGSEDTSSPYSIPWNTTQASNGSHTLTATVRDAAGNSTPSSGITVTVNNVTPPTTVATPNISPNGGSFTTTQSVSLSTATSGATIRYTTDGSTPSSTTGTIYSSAFNIASTSTVKAIAYKAGSTDSSVASATFTITPPPTTGPAPVISSFFVSSKTQTSATLKWKTNIPATGSLSYGTNRNSLNLSDPETNPATCTSTGCIHTLTLSGLTRNTTYYYRITATNNNSSTTSIRSSFKTRR